MNKIRKPRPTQKPPPLAGVRVESVENEIQFEMELCWCVQQLEKALCTNKLSQKIAEDTAKNVKMLKSSTVPLIKKRQIMKLTFGDYRAKMREEEKKLALMSKQIKFTANADADKKSCFVKKSAILQSGKDFRFNFTPEETEKDEPTTAQKSLDGSSEESCNKSTVLINKELNLESGSEFKFNFAINETNDALNLSELSIKS